MRNTFVDTLCRLAREDDSVILITGDLGFGVLNPFWNEFPGRFFNAGIAEQGMTGIAAGLALSGKTVFTYSIANFPTIRCLEQVRNDCAYHGANVKIVSVGAGLTYGPLGMSHHATEDISIMRALPGVKVFSPADQSEARRCTTLMYETPGTCYMRLGRGGETPVHPGSMDFALGEILEVRRTACAPGNMRIAMLATGSIVADALVAAETLHTSGVGVTVYSCPTVKPLDQEAIAACTAEYDIVATIEEHTVVGGLGGAVAEIMAGLGGRKARLVRIGIEDTYTSEVGSQDYLKRHYGLSAEGIVRRLASL